MSTGVPGPRSLPADVRSEARFHQLWQVQLPTLSVRRGTTEIYDQGRLQ